MTRIATVLPTSLALAVALVTASCATAPEVSAPEGGPLRIEGRISRIDLQPWTYDGNAIVEVEVEGRGTVQVGLPARWNLCQAAPVDMQALAVGMRVQASGEATGEGGLVVCQDASHLLEPMQ